MLLSAQNKIKLSDHFLFLVEILLINRIKIEIKTIHYDITILSLKNVLCG